MIGYLSLGVVLHCVSLYLIFTRHLDDDNKFVYINKVNNDNQIFPVCLQIQIQTILYLLSLSGHFKLYKKYFPTVANASVSLLTLFVLENRTNFAIFSFFFLIPVLGNILIIYLLDIKFPRSRKGEGLPNIAMSLIHYLNFAQYRGTGSFTEMVGFTIFHLGIIEIGTFISSFLVRKFDKSGEEEETPAKVKKPE